MKLDIPESFGVDATKLGSYLSKQTKKSLLCVLLQSMKETPSIAAGIQRTMESKSWAAEIEEFVTAEMKMNEERGKLKKMRKKAKELANPSAASYGPKKRFEGTVFHWMHSKGWGRLRMDKRPGVQKGGEKVFCHISECWLDEGQFNPLVGSRVEFSIEEYKDGKVRKKRAKNVTGVGGVTCDGGRAKGVVVAWNDKMRRGMIAPNDGSDKLIVHPNDIWSATPAFEEGDAVEFDFNPHAVHEAIWVTKEGERVMECLKCKGRGHYAVDCPAATTTLGVGAAVDDPDTNPYL